MATKKSDKSQEESTIPPVEELLLEAVKELSRVHEFSISKTGTTWELRVGGSRPWCQRAQDLGGLLRWWRGGASLTPGESTEIKPVVTTDPPRSPARLRLRR